MEHSSKGSPPRVVVITRETPYEALIARHGTRSQAEFFLSRRDASIDGLAAIQAAQDAAVRAAVNAIPSSWRRARVRRPDLSRFLFEPNDTIVAVGQDGLVANVAKYLRGQLVVGINPSPERYDGVLVPYRPGDAKRVILAAGERRAETESRTMVEVALDDGRSLVALNEVFIGHRTHQSARYSLACRGACERHSSSGLIIASGTGATGWARSIHRERRSEVPLPNPTEPALAFFVREAFPSVATGTNLTEGRVDEGGSLTVVSELDEGGVIFGDGIEADRLEFGYGTEATIRVASVRLKMVRMTTKGRRRRAQHARRRA